MKLIYKIIAVVLSLILFLPLNISSYANIISNEDVRQVEKNESEEIQFKYIRFDKPYFNQNKKTFIENQKVNIIPANWFSLFAERYNLFINSSEINEKNIDSLAEGNNKLNENSKLPTNDYVSESGDVNYAVSSILENEILYKNNLEYKLSDSENEYTEIPENEVKEIRLVNLNLNDEINNSFDNVFYGTVIREENDFLINLKLIKSIESKGDNSVRTEYKYTFNDKTLEFIGDDKTIIQEENNYIYNDVEFKVKSLSDTINITKVVGEDLSNLELKIDPSSLTTENLNAELSLNNLYKINFLDSEKLFSTVYNKLMLNKEIFICDEDQNLYNQNSILKPLEISVISDLGKSNAYNIRYTINGNEPDLDNSRKASFNNKGNDYSIKLNPFEFGNILDGYNAVIKLKMFYNEKPISKSYKLTIKFNKFITSEISNSIRIGNAKADGKFQQDLDLINWKMFYDTIMKTKKIELDKNTKEILKQKKIGRYYPIKFSIMQGSKLAEFPLGWNNEVVNKVLEKFEKEYETTNLMPMIFSIQNLNLADLETFENINSETIKIYKLKENNDIEPLEKDYSDLDKMMYSTTIDDGKMNFYFKFKEPVTNLIIAEENSLSDSDIEGPTKPIDNDDTEIKELKKELEDYLIDAENKINILNKKPDAVVEFNKTLEAAKSILKDSNNKDEIEMAINTVIKANSVIKSQTILNENELTEVTSCKEEIKPGVYSIYGEVRKWGEIEKYSMSNETINHRMKLIVDKDGNRKLRIEFKGKMIGELVGNLLRLFYFNTTVQTIDTSYGSNLEKQLGEVNRAKVIKTRKGIGVDGKEHEGLPEILEIKLDSFKNDPKRYLGMVMDVFSPYEEDGNKLTDEEAMGGMQKAVLCLDYRTLEKTDEELPVDPEQPTDPEQPVEPVEPLYPELGDIDTTNDPKDTVYYQVPVEMMNAIENKVSMGAAALVKSAIVKQNKDGYKYYVTFKGMDKMNLHGHIYDLEVYKDKLKSELTPATLDKEYEDKDINGDQRTFPERYSFVRENKDSDIYVKMYVDAMDALGMSPGEDGKISYDDIQKGKSAPNAKLVFDWANAKKLGEEKPKPKPSRPSHHSGGGSSSSEVVKPVVAKTSERVSGNNRYSTSVKISKKFFKKANTIVLASGVNSADALVSSSFAEINKAPILLSGKNSLDSDLISELERLGSKEVVIVGGEASISADIEKALINKGYKVRRIAGKNRYETSAKIAQEVKAKTSSKDAILINGQKDADALTVSSLATKESIPVIMTGNNGLSEEAKNKLEEWNVEKLIVVGGTASISEEVFNSVKAQSKIRLAGKDRYETAIKIAKESYPNAKNAMLGSGENAIDALSAGAVTKSIKAPILLTKKNVLNSATKNILEQYKLNNLYILGGGNTISRDVENEVKGN